MSINENLKQLRLSSGMTQEQVANQVGITRQALSSYESGRTRPDIDMLMKLAEIYDTDLDGILYGENRILQMNTRVKKIAKIYLILYSGLWFLWSAIGLIKNQFFLPPELLEETQTVITEEMKPMIETRLMLNEVGGDIELLARWIGIGGAVLLVFLMMNEKCRISVKEKIIFLLILTGAIYIPMLIVGWLDPLGSFRGYALYASIYFLKVLGIFALQMIAECIIRRKKKKA